jgi:hypothetical protein
MVSRRRQSGDQEWAQIGGSNGGSKRKQGKDTSRGITRTCTLALRVQFTHELELAMQRQW